MRLARFLLATERTAPADAEIISHRLLLRAGMIRKVAAGIYTFLPLGLRVLHKVEAIIRREMDAAGAQEILMPALQPADLWKRTGRWFQYGPEMMRLTDRGDREFCLGPTHEELVTDLVSSEVTSYRQLPLTVYQIQDKFRDEIRPRFGLMRVREFLMKDAYSFDADPEGMRRTYRRMYEAYDRIFAAMGLNFRPVEAATGLIGGDISHEFMVLASTGEEGIAFCSDCDYAANVEVATFRRREPSGEEMRPLSKASTPGKMRADEVSEFLGVAPDSLLKTMIYRVGDSFVAAVVPGDREVNAAKLARLTGEQAVLLQPEDFGSLGLPFGFVGPVGLELRMLADEEVQGLRNVVVGANEKDYHLRDANPGRDFTPERYCDVVTVIRGDPCAQCGGTLDIARGIEVGQLFQLGMKYSSAMGATFTAEDGSSRPFVMGCYGIGVGRTMAAAIEQHNDERGIVWPPAIAPFQVVILPLRGPDGPQFEIGEELYQKLLDEGWEAALDDRDETPGVKFADADLVGYPLQVVCGRGVEKGNIEIKVRSSGERRTVAVSEGVEELRRLWRELTAS